MSIATLHYCCQDNSIPLPIWANWFIDTGIWLARKSKDSGRVVLAIATPTRAYAAALLAFGLICERVTIPPDDLSEHILQLRSLPKGTPIVYRDGKKRYKGEYIGIEFKKDKKDDIEKIGIHTGGKNNTWVTFEHALKIETVDDNGSSSGKRMRTRKISTSDFLRSCCAMQPSSVEYLTTNSREECMIFSQQNLLRKEINETLFVNNNAQGTLQELVRVKDFLIPGDAYRSSVYPMGKLQQVEQDSVPYTVIFDGAKGYLRWRHKWPSTHQVVVLDYTDAEYPDAVNALNECYPYRIVDADLSDLPTPPNELSVMGYWEETP